ncbi:F-box/FBD/LRR-repeat protein [Senna tora]|uniref:F-box/FBD/LRR-repeat protein n=1 Tax=Senna tora TaxID=362788 RepID=A0A834SQS5_9FABA|nr:F-box/FBD/LRR-repeat protein [Senna tora]
MSVFFISSPSKRKSSGHIKGVICGASNDVFLLKEKDCFEITFDDAGSKKKMSEEKRDMISKLPDDIIVNIISRLTTEEAARTSILSTRWTPLWLHSHGFFNFDNSLRIYRLRRRQCGQLRKIRLFLSEWQRFMNTLQKTLDSLQTPTIKGLRICIDLGNPRKIPDWLNFASRKKVETLELDFTFTYTYLLLGIRDSIRNLLSPDLLFGPRGFKFQSLHVLRLASVDITGDTLQQFLSGCSCLETLCVRDSRILTHLKVASGTLKHLELEECNVPFLEVSAQNLVVFTYSGEVCDSFPFKCVPNLEQVSFGGPYARYVETNMKDIDFFRLFSQLSVVKLELRARDETIHVDLPEFSNVKHLELFIPHAGGINLSRHVSLLSAFPSICKLKLKFQSFGISSREVMEFEGNLKHEYERLEELEVCGYRRDPCQIEFILYVVENAANLKRIAFDPVSTFYSARTADVKKVIGALRRDSLVWFADGLKPYIPDSVELIVL